LNPAQHAFIINYDQLIRIPSIITAYFSGILFTLSSMNHTE